MTVGMRSDLRHLILSPSGRKTWLIDVHEVVDS